MYNVVVPEEGSASWLEKFVRNFFSYRRCILALARHKILDCRDGIPVHSFELELLHMFGTYTRLDLCECVEDDITLHSPS